MALQCQAEPLQPLIFLNRELMQALFLVQIL